MTKSDSLLTNRTEAFSDGVLAIAITLLVLEIRPPVLAHGESLAHALAHLWPKYAAFAVSFITIGIMWIFHHSLFRLIGRVDRPMMMINICLLMAISFVPFPTAVLGDYVTNESAGHVAAALYGVNMVLIGLGFLALWLRLLQQPELRADVDESGVRRGIRRTVVGPICYAIAIAVSFLSAAAALVVYAALAIYFAVGRDTRSAN